MEKIIDRKPILTISMLISGKEDMKKSLKSLQYFKRELSCEIILVDTGCNAEQRAMAECYADKIYDFVWCDDFAMARNVGLKAARGEWFLYLDDDEWFDNPVEIIKFFVSGEYRKYSSATYKIRNYIDDQGRSYNETTATRIIKLEKETVFVGKIHEYLYPFTVPTKNLSDFVHHYGYVFKDDEEKRRHAYRNIEPLIKMTEEEPEDIRWSCQLAQEYFALEEHAETVRICENSLVWQKEHKGKKENDPAWIGAIYSFLLISLESQREFDKEEQWLKKALEEPAMPEATRAFFYLAGIRLYSLNGLKEYGKCRDCVKEYIKYKYKIGDNKEAVSFGTSLITSAVFQEHRSYPAMLLSMNALIRLEDYALAEEAFYLIDWSDRRMLYQNQQEKIIVDACCSMAYHPLWSSLLQTLVSREDGMKEMYVVFLETEIMYKRQGEFEKLFRLRRLVSELDCEHHYILYTKIIFEAQKMERTGESVNTRKSIAGFFAQLFEKHTEKLLDIKKDVWNVAENMDIQIEPMFLKINYRKWKDVLEKWCREVSVEDLREWDKRMKNWKTVEDFRYSIFDIKCAEGFLFCYQKEKAGIVQWEEAFWRYADSVLKFYKSLYRESVFEECPEVLPDEVWIALHLRKLHECREKSDDKGALSVLRKCIGIFPVLEKALEAYAEVLKREIQNRDQEAEKAKQELEILVSSLKATVKLRIERGEYQAAKEILLQMQSYVQEDEEIQELLKQTEKEL